MEIEKTEIYKYLKSKNNTFYCEHINKVTADVQSILSRIPAMFSNYTNHDISHSVRVANNMVELLPQAIEKYNDTELVIMLYSAIFHDVGMAVPDTESKLNPSNQNSIRKNHHIRSADFINNYSEKYCFNIDNEGSINFRTLVALISRSHGEDFSWINNNLSNREWLGTDIVNPQFISCLLRLGDFLDFDSRRTPSALYDFLNLSSISNTEWKKHLVITNYSKIEKNNIYFTGECEEPEIFLGILNYFSLIEKEIKDSKELLSKNEKKYLLAISDKIQNNISHKTFDSVDLQFSMDYLAISNLLMGKNLYNDKKCALREIIQNSLDATLLKKEIYKRKGINYIPAIKIIYTNDEVTIQDNGIGMDQFNIKKYFLKIGQSFYSSSDFRNLNLDYKPISHYGIGFLSAFLLSDSLIIKTSFYQDPKTCNILQLKKHNRFIIQKEETNTCPDSGTTIIFDKNMFTKVFENGEAGKEYIEETFNDTEVKITISENESESELFLNDKTNNNCIDISEYLNNVNCCFNLLGIRKDEVTLRTITDKGIPFEASDDYIYDSELFPEEIIGSKRLVDWMEESESSYCIDRLLDDDQRLQFLDVYPLDFDETECFNQAQEILDDNDGAFEYLQKTHSVYDPIRIYIRNESIFYDFEDFELMDMDVDIRGYSETVDFKRALKSFVEEHEDYDVCSILIRSCHQSVFINDDYFSRIKYRREISNYHKNLLYIKNVRIPYFNIPIPVILKELLFANFKINISSENCFPDVSRSTLNNDICKKLGYAIGRAIHIFLLKKVELKETERLFLKAFIKNFYKYDSKNEFCKKINS